MRSFLDTGIVKPAGWLALAYLGYWPALVLDQLLVALVVSPLTGAPVTGWRLTAFRAVVENADLQKSPALATFLDVLPLLLQVLFLAGLVVLGGRLRSHSVRVWLGFTGLWAILLMAVPLFLLVYLDRGALARLLALLAGQAPLSLATRIAVAVAAALPLVAAARVCTGRLIVEARNGWLPQRRAWLAVLALVLPPQIIVAGAFNIFSSIRYVGWRALPFVLLPTAVCLALALAGLTWKPQSAATTPGRGFISRGALAAVCVSALLAGGLHQSQGLRQWAAERRQERTTSSHYEVLHDPRAHSAEAIQRFAAEREATLAKLAARFNVPADGVRLRVVLYASFPSKQAATGNMRPYSVEGATIRAVLGGSVKRLDPAADAAAFLNTVWGPPGSERMGEWSARWLAGEWRGQDLRSVAAQIEREVGHYTLAQLLDSGSDGYLSPLVRNPLGGAWVGTVFDRSGLAAVQELRAAKPPRLNTAGLAHLLAVAPDQLEQDWKQRSAGLISLPAADPPKRLPEGDSFFRGISFSHEGWREIGGGYASPAAAAELRRIRALGANAIAVVPYGFTRGAGAQAITYTRTDETDEDLTEALHVAHALDMKVLLKPQLWVAREEFTGAIRFDDPAARAAWMRGYREFILHYARLAELEGFDLLSIGNELAGVTAYADDWRRLIADVRRVYHGPLTYAANWGREVDAVDFWDALDYIGVNNYYPLAASGSATAAPPRAEDLLAAAENLATKFEAASLRWHKPVLFTEVGYPSVRGGARKPWVEEVERGISMDEQAASYEATLRAFAGRPWFRGMFWWKWPSSGRGGGPTDFSYTPRGKPAEGVLRGWFTRLADTPPSPATQSR